MFQFQSKHQAAPRSFWGTEGTRKPQPPSHTQNLLAAAGEALMLLYSDAQTQKHTSKQANGHAEMKSTFDTVRGQEAKNSSSTWESCSNSAVFCACTYQLRLLK